MPWITVWAASPESRSVVRKEQRASGASAPSAQREERVDRRETSRESAALIIAHTFQKLVRQRERPNVGRSTFLYVAPAL